MKKTVTLKHFIGNIFNRKLLSAAALKVSFVVLCSLFSLQSLQAQTVYASTTGGKLISFNVASPGILLADVPINGIAPDQQLEGIDFRPATGQLFALGYNAATGQAQVYTIKTTSGNATPIGNPILLAAGMNNIGFDFNPTVDRIRVTSGNGNNYRLNPNNGAIAATDMSLAYAAGDPNAGQTPMVYAVAYTNSMANAASTTLFFYDFGLNVVGTVIPPNNGVLNTVGSSGIGPVTNVGLDFDILTNKSDGTNAAYLTANVSASGTNFYTLNLGTGAASLVGAIGSGLNITQMSIEPSRPVPGRIVYGVSSGNLIKFNTSTPGTILSSIAITGLGSGENILGIDFRPATGELYALGSASRLYKINVLTGVATQVGVNGAFTLMGSKFGFDFNPTVDRIRVTSDMEQNLRLNPNDGTLAATDQPLQFNASDANSGANPNVQAVAYTNSFGMATSTTLYFYDAGLNIIGTVIPPNAGTLNTIGASGIAVSTGSGVDMDITSDRFTGANMAYLSASTNGTSTTLYRVNLTSGSSTMVGAIGANLLVDYIAIYSAPPPPVRLVYAVSQQNLISFNTNNPATLLSNMPLTGITSGQVVEGLDFRPATGDLYAFGYNVATGQAQVYTVNVNTGSATAVGSPATLPTGLNSFSFDFNPEVDRLRVISSSGLNYRFHPETGALVATDTPLSFAEGDMHQGVQPLVFGAAYSNNLNGTSNTQLYYYDLNLDKLLTTLPPASPNSGTLNTIGLSGLVTQNGLGLDIDIYTDPESGQNTGFLTANVGGGANSFYQVNLETGEAQLIAYIGDLLIIDAMAVSLNDDALPVTLAEFAAVKIGTTAEVTWKTVTEVNNDYFIVERSADGTSFTPLSGQVASRAANGNSTGQLNYAFTDGKPLSGANFYRLMQVDKDGRKNYSNVVRLQFDGVSSARVYPNPVQSTLNLAGYTPGTANLQVTVSDVNGRIILTRNFNKQPGNWNVQLNMASLNSGMYFVQLYDGTSRLFSQSVYKN